MPLRIRPERPEDAGAIATGENLGQVASQTIPNLAAIEQAIDIPVLRPLVTYDKNEIIQTAKKIGTFETSILPYDDCCSLFAPRHPATRVDTADVLELEARIKNYDALLDQAFEKREIVDLDG